MIAQRFGWQAASLIIVVVVVVSESSTIQGVGSGGSSLLNISTSSRRDGAASFPMTTEASTTNVESRKTFHRRTLPKSCTALSSSQGQRIFASALASSGLKSFFPLIEQFTTQSEPAYCGISTLVVVLNALSIDPRQTWKGPWRWYEERMLNCCLDLEEVKKSGITLKGFYCLAVCQGVAVDMNYVDEKTSVDDFRSAVKKACVEEEQEQEQEQDEDDVERTFLVVSYSRKILGQTGTGHFSPIAAYDAKTDSVLVLDTARFKYGAHWVPLSLMFEAMKPLDPDTGRSRGYTLLSRNSTDEEAENEELRFFNRSLPTSVLFQSKKSQNPFRRSYKEYLLSLSSSITSGTKINDNNESEISWGQVVAFWTKDGAEPTFIWNMMQPQLTPIKEDDPDHVQLIVSLRELINALIPSKPAFPSNSKDCRSNHSRMISLSPEEMVFVVYLASLNEKTRRDVVYSSAAASSSSSAKVPDRVREQLLAEAVLTRYALDMSDQTADFQ